MTDAWLPTLPENLLVGTSSFSSEDWREVFYPPELPPGERIGWYARNFPTVEVDTTWYRMPTRRMLSNWLRLTPDRFIFALKVPREITHDRQLVGCQAATAELLDVTSLLGERRGPLLLQFPYLAKGEDPVEHRTGRGFVARLADWLDDWAAAADWVVEVRNRSWLEQPLLDLLAAHQVPLALTEYTTMPPYHAFDSEAAARLLTGRFAYVRFHGDRRRLDRRVDELIATGQKTCRYNELVIDAAVTLRQWIDALLPVVTRRRTFAFFNNHFAGFGPGSARQFALLWREIHDLAE